MTHHTPQTSGHSGTMITAFFDRQQDAETAVEHLTTAGVDRNCIQMTSGTSAETGYRESSTREDKGFFESLGDFFFPDEDRQVYAEGLSRGGILLTVRDFPSNLYDTVLDVLDDAGAVDVEDRAESWRAEGWTGAAAGTLAGGSAHTMASDRSDAGAGGVAHHADDGVIPVVQEELRVGKRDVSHGRVRVRSYVYETPVSEEVELSEERVEIDRRPVDRPAAAGDDLFRERSIEAEEHREEAVVSKEARVTEEIELRRTAETHRETVSDTVRHTEVEIEDDRDDTARQAR